MNLYALLFAMSTVLSLLFVGMGWMIWKLFDTGKCWLLLADQDSGSAILRRIKPVRGEYRNAKSKERYILEHAGSLGTKRGRLFMKERKTGTTLLVPTRAQLGAHSQAHVMRIFDPTTLFKMAQMDVVGNYVKQNQEVKPSWMEKALPWAFGAIAIMVVVLGAVAWKLLPGVTG